jgi:3-phenylpropionate/trans-cinnamate dioxygenase ferredoxin reductase subunit
MSQAQSSQPVCVVIGASHAGSLLAVQVRKEGWQGRIVLISAEKHLPYHRPPLSKAILSGEKEIEAVLLRPALLYSNNNIELRLGEQVTQISRADKTIHLASGETLDYDKLALCTGATPRRLPMGEGLAGVHYLRNADDVAAIKSQMQFGKRAIIIGGGYIGLEVAAVMSQHGLQVSVVEMTDRLLQRVASPAISAYFRLLHEHHDVDILTNARVEAIRAAGTTLSVLFEGGGVFAADLVVIGIGVLPETALASAAGLEVADGIVVDAFMGTSDPDILAAGDCTAFPSARYGAIMRLESVQNALDQARVAAANVCGKPVIYDALPWFWSDQYDVKLQSVGLRLDHEHEIVRGNPNVIDGKGICVFYLRGDQMIAADCVNRAKEFMACKKLIAERMPINLEALVDETLGPESFAAT